MPVVVSFTVETNGKLVTGDSVESVIKRIDDLSGSYPLFYSINCAHPSHLMELEVTDDTIKTRLRSLHPNASRKSHAELNESTELDQGDVQLIGKELKMVTERYSLDPCLLGGCCGTNVEHIESISSAFSSKE